MTHSQATISAEIAADRADRRYFTAYDADEHPDILGVLATEAHIARTRWEDLALSEMHEPA